ncbi:di- and tripeptidase [Kocuria sp. LUK]|uniref:di- and tripeptidase n=1 Tax=Kocuria TaxID=57493 RepID=UPI001E29925D|nr:di- and tripeptidase [Kocuria sp. LUK]MCD1145515.1 di- and tripeptidase [Kocuria sp. LUK]
MDLNPLNKAFDDQGRPRPAMNKVLDTLLRVQRPVVLAFVKKELAEHPGETPEQIARRLEKIYVRSVTLGGGAVGATAVVPGIGTVASLGLSSVAVVGYLEATALYAQAVAELHGVHTEDPERTRTMVMALMLGEDGRQVMNQILMSGTKGKGMVSSWGLMMGKDDSRTFDVGRTIRNMFVKRFIAKQTGAVFGRALPFGIGAVVGGGANLAMAKQVIAATHEAFGPLPAAFPDELAAVHRAPRFRGGGDAAGQDGPEGTVHGEITAER